MNEMRHQPCNPPGEGPVPVDAGEFPSVSSGSDSVVPTPGKRARVQLFLDAELEEITADKVAEHLEDFARRLTDHEEGGP